MEIDGQSCKIARYSLMGPGTSEIPAIPYRRGGNSTYIIHGVTAWMGPAKRPSMWGASSYIYLSFME